MNLKQKLSEFAKSWTLNIYRRHVFQRNNIDKVNMTQTLSEFTNSWTPSFGSLVLHYSGIPLKLCREGISLNETHQAGEPETEFVRIYDVVNYGIQLFCVECLSKKNIKQVHMKPKLFEFTNSWTTSFNCLVLQYFRIPLKLYGEDMPLKAHQQASAPETELVRIYEFVD